MSIDDLFDDPVKPVKKKIVENKEEKTLKELLITLNENIEGLSYIIDECFRSPKVVDNKVKLVNVVDMLFAIGKVIKKMERK